MRTPFFAVFFVGRVYKTPPYEGYERACKKAPEPFGSGASMRFYGNQNALHLRISF